MAVDCIAALDQGTQSTRVTLYDSEAHVIAKSQHDFPQLWPQAGCATAQPVSVLCALATSSTLR